MKLQLDLPDNTVEVRDTSNYKGVPITVLSVFGVDVAYYIGNSTTEYNCLDNSDWEGILRRRMAEFFGEMLIKEFPKEWSEENPTGRELSDYDRVVYLAVDNTEEGC